MKENLVIAPIFETALVIWFTLVTYTADVMLIGCKTYPIDDWWEFNDDQDDPRARKWKPILKQIIETSPAKKLVDI